MFSVTISRAEITQRIVTAGAVAILRLKSSRRVLPVAEAMLRGGVTVLEVTLTTPGALAATERLASQLSPAVLVGVGSVLNANDVAQAADSGARYIVSPIATPEIIESAHKRGLPVMPGAFTPTEMQRAQALGADLIKVFPAEFWGPKYLKAILAPMPQLRLCPAGGVTPENAGAWIQAGALAVGVGSALIDSAAVEACKFEELTRRARVLVQSIESVR